MRTYAPNPNFTEIKRQMNQYRRIMSIVGGSVSIAFRDFDHMTQAVIEGSVFADSTPETDHPEICPE